MIEHALQDEERGDLALTAIYLPVMHNLIKERKTQEEKLTY